MKTTATRVVLPPVKPQRPQRLKHNLKVSHHRPSRRGRAALLHYEGGADYGRRA